jgi:hypothetical protein
VYVCARRADFLAAVAEPSNSAVEVLGGDGHYAHPCSAPLITKKVKHQLKKQTFPAGRIHAEHSGVFACQLRGLGELWTRNLEVITPCGLNSAKSGRWLPDKNTSTGQGQVRIKCPRAKSTASGNQRNVSVLPRLICPGTGDEEQLNGRD